LDRAACLGNRLIRAKLFVKGGINNIA
jgi:hypothetical protein